jgi:Transposase DDE domain group 1
MSAAHRSMFEKPSRRNERFNSGKSNGHDDIVIGVASKQRGSAIGGVCAGIELLKKSGLGELIDSKLIFNKGRRGYSASTHIFNIALNTFSGGTTLDEIELRRKDESFRAIFSGETVPAPTTEGDFCRKFRSDDIEELQCAFNETRANIWRCAKLSGQAVIDADGVFVNTNGECKEGAAFTYKKTFGYHVLNVSLANTLETLFLDVRPGNRPSHEGAALRFTQAAELCLRNGFTSVLLRGDTDFSQTVHLGDWDAKGYKFIFGFDANQTVKAIASELNPDAWKPLCRVENGVCDEDTFETYTDEERERRHNFKLDEIRSRGYRHLELIEERISEFKYQPSACDRAYRMIVIKKRVLVTKGYEPLLEDVRYFFYISNEEKMSAEEIVKSANQRCAQENIHAILKDMGVLRAPLGDLNSNWAYMVITSLAWNLKAWIGLKMRDSLKCKHGVFSGLRKRIMTMEFRTFLNHLIHIPILVRKKGKKIFLDILSDSIWSYVLLDVVKLLSQ